MARINDENRIDVLSSDVNKLAMGDQENKGRKMNVLDDFEIGRAIGQGKFGTVFLCRDRRSRFVMAMKVLFKNQVEKYSMIPQLERELSIQYHMTHENILRLYSYFECPKHLYVLLEYCDGGTLMKKMKQQNNKLSSPQAAFYLEQIVKALIHCHERKVFHRDLKLENLLLTDDEVVKLADFGWSVHVPAADMRRSTTCGTLDYLSPEMIEEIPHDQNVDNWSVGILLYEFLVGKGPFVVESTTDTMSRIMKVQYEFPAEFPEGAKEIVSKLLVKDPSARMALSAVKTHYWTVTEAEKYRQEKQLRAGSAVKKQ